MSMSLLVTGTFKNGKRRSAGYHSSSNKLIQRQDLAPMLKLLESDIYPVIEKFSKITVSFNMSYTTTLKPNLSKSIEVWGRPDIQAEVRRAVLEMNDEVRRTQ